MARSSCSTSRISRPPQPQSARSCDATSSAQKNCLPAGHGPAFERPILEGQNLITSAAHNLSLNELAVRLRVLGPLERQKCNTYVVKTVRPVKGEMVQMASAPNFDGGFITLNTCKHSMRTLLPAEAWQEGVWIAGMNSWDVHYGKQQGLVYLMRVGEAYNSHFELIQAFEESGRSATVDVKAATTNRRGDIMIPRSAQLPPAEHRAVSGYLPPMVGHAHRAKADHTYWEDDINHVSKKGVPASLLVGDPAFSFTWSKQMVRNQNPGNLRPWRDWDLGTLLSYLEDFPK